MNFIQKIKIWWLHMKMQLWGDRDFDCTGNMTIPCRKCGKIFLSWLHYEKDSLVYDSLCDKCLEEED
jgi:hypothetical protein